MSRAHAVAPVAGPTATYPEPAPRARTSAARLSTPCGSCYVERAMLLWPRLDRAKLRRYADDPVRIAELVERRTSQPYDVILAMLTRQSDRLAAPTEASAGFESGNAEAARVAFRVVRTERRKVEDREALPA